LPLHVAHKAKRSQAHARPTVSKCFNRCPYRSLKRVRDNNSQAGQHHAITGHGTLVCGMQGLTVSRVDRRVRVIVTQLRAILESSLNPLEISTFPRSGQNRLEHCR